MSHKASRQSISERRNCDIDWCGSIGLCYTCASGSAYKSGLENAVIIHSIGGTSLSGLHPRRISRIERRVPHISIQVHLIRIENRIGLQEPPQLRIVLARAIVIEIHRRIPAPAGIAERVARGAVILNAIGRVDIIGRDRAVFGCHGNDIAQTVGVIVFARSGSAGCGVDGDHRHALIDAGSRDVARLDFPLAAHLDQFGDFQHEVYGVVWVGKADITPTAFPDVMSGPRVIPALMTPGADGSSSHRCMCCHETPE